MEVISAQQVWPKSFLIWTRLSLLIASHASIFSGLSPFILKEKHFHTFLSLFFLVLCVIIHFVIYLYYHKNGAYSQPPIDLYVLDFWKINSEKSSSTNWVLVYFKLYFYWQCSLQRDRARRALLQHQNFNFLFYLGWSGCFTQSKHTIMKVVQS